jgi:hypothetical protein
VPTLFPEGFLDFRLGVARRILGTDIKVKETLSFAVGEPTCRLVTHLP